MSGDDDRFAKSVGAVMSDEDEPRLERYAHGEASPEEVRALYAEAANDPKLAVALELYAPLSDAVKAKLIPNANVVRPRRWIAFASGAAAAAIAASVALFAFNPSAGVRAKNGDELHLSCWPPGAPKAERCASGDRVVPSTAVMFHLRLGGDREVMMLGRDGNGAWKSYFPREGGRSAFVQRDRSDFVGASLKLDATPGEERFVVLVAPSDRRFDVAEVEKKLDDLASLPKEIESFDVRLEKRP